MPGLPDCPMRGGCPMADDPDTPCAVLLNHARGMCASKHPGMRDSVRRMSLQMAGKWVAPEAAAPPSGLLPATDISDRCELVVARHMEPWEWLLSVPHRVRLHTAPLAPDATVPAHFTLVDKPNVGREAGVYLRHICDRYDDLAELTFFTQANPFDHSPDFLERIRFRYDAPTSLSARYKASFPPHAVKAQDLVETVHGFEVRYGKVDAAGANWKLVDRSVWEQVFACPPPDPWYFGYAALWAVPWWSIRARPLGFWRWLNRELERNERGRNNTKINPWTLEGTWRYLFADPAEYPHRWPDVEEP